MYKMNLYKCFFVKAMLGAIFLVIIFYNALKM